MKMPPESAAIVIISRASSGVSCGAAAMATSASTANSDRSKNNRAAWLRAIERIKGKPDRKSTRLNSSHLVISYAVFCLKNKLYTIRPILHIEQHDLSGSLMPIPGFTPTYEKKAFTHYDCDTFKITTPAASLLLT